jgi:outer membrane protein OmpA-like peptidoglycan-associated protein
MTVINRRRSLPVLGGLSLGTMLFLGCASVAKGDPPALPPPPSWAPAPRPAVASGDELDARSLAANSRERENEVAPRVTMKGFKAIEWTTPKPTPERGVSSGGASAVYGAVGAVGAPAVPAFFAERRSSEALDRLAGLVIIRRERRGAVITLSSDRLVESGQWVLTSSGKYTVKELAAGLRDQEGRAIFIQGYTDSMGSPVVNDLLSLRRAEAVRDYLTSLGVAPENMHAEGFGAKRPVAQNATPDGRAQNRRIEIVIAPAATANDEHENHPR